MAGTRNGVLNRLPIALRIPELNLQDRVRWQTAINRQSAECGCKAGALAICIAEVGYVISLLLGITAVSGWAAAGIGAGLAFAAAIIGKSIGITRSEIRRRRLVADLMTAIEDYSDLRS